MREFKIDSELPNKRAIVKGPYAWLCVDDNIVVTDNAENIYNAVVETRILGGAVVRIVELV